MYELKTLQYGEYEDVYTNLSLDDLLHHLENVEICRAAVEYIKKNGVKLSVHEVESFQNMVKDCC